MVHVVEEDDAALIGALRRGVPDGYEWLLRSDGPGRFFANVSERAFANSGGLTGRRYTARGSTPAAAIEAALANLGRGDDDPVDHGMPI